MEKVTIIGGGNGAFAAASDLTIRRLRCMSCPSLQRIWKKFLSGAASNLRHLKTTD